MIKKYRKRPVIIQAMQLDPSWDGIKAFLEFTKEEGESTASDEDLNAFCKVARENENDGIVISTLEGDMLASWGDYIVKGVKGEFYPVKEDIFHMTYEEVSDNSPN